MASKQALFHFYLVLKDYSHENHPLSSTDIIELMKNKYNQDITRQTIYSYIQYLQDLDIDIIKTSKGIYVVPLFESEEVEWLYHSIVSNGTLPECYSKNLIEKILITQPLDSRKEKEDYINLINVDKKENKDILYTLGKINEAIKADYSLIFNYTKYDVYKNIVNRRPEPYIVIPYCVVCHSGKMYMICQYEGKDDLSSYRLDRIRDIELHEKVVKNISIDPYSYVKNRLYMHNGKTQTFGLRCKNNILDDVIDMFGKDVDIYSPNNETFDAYVKTTRQEIKYFALQFLEYVEVIYPTDIREEISQLLKKNLDKYK